MIVFSQSLPSWLISMAFSFVFDLIQYKSLLIWKRHSYMSALIKQTGITLASCGYPLLATQKVTSKYTASRLSCLGPQVLLSCFMLHFVVILIPITPLWQMTWSRISMLTTSFLAVPLHRKLCTITRGSNLHISSVCTWCRDQNVIKGSKPVMQESPRIKNEITRWSTDQE